MYGKYAIIITTYNRKQLLQECIDRVCQQTVPADSIIIVNNASTDGTNDYLEQLSLTDGRYDIINLPDNIGGAGGFTKGIERAMQKSVDCVLLIDDDAMLADDFMEQLLKARQEHPQYKAFAGIVKANGKIDMAHRKNFSKVGLLPVNIKAEEYSKPYFECEVATFCGMLVDTDIIHTIGLPHAEYFIWHDDAEYSLRINQYSKFLTVTGAELVHKTKPVRTTGKRRYDWREYYAVRNRILMVREHGNVCDRMVNDIDLFINVIFRNWLFSMIKKDGYDWNYEKMLVDKAVRDAVKGKLDNQIIMRG